MLLPQQARLQQDIEDSLSKILELVRHSNGELRLSPEVLCTMADDMWKALIVGLAQLGGASVDNESEALMCLNARGYPAGPCSNMWRPGQLAVRCKQCQISDSSAICVDCYKASHHEGHDVVLYYSQSGGVCDCGCPEAWNDAGCCTSHKLRQEPATLVALADWEQSLLEAAFRISFHLLAGADVEPCRLLSSLVRLCKTPCLRSVAVAAIADSRPGGWKPAASGFTWDRLQEAFPMLEDPETFQPSAGLRSLLKRAAFQKNDHEESAKLLLMLMTDAGTKLCVGQLLFTDLWERFGWLRLGFASLGQSISSMRFIQMIIVQILASEEVVLKMQQHSELMQLLLKAALVPVQRFSAGIKAAHPQQPPNMSSLAEVVHTVLSEIGTALAAPSVKLMAFQNLHVLAGMFKIMWQLHRVSTHFRQRDGHIEYESTACLWTLQLEQQICCSLLDPLLEVAEASFCTHDVAVEVICKALNAWHHEDCRLPPHEQNDRENEIICDSNGSTLFEALGTASLQVGVNLPGARWLAAMLRALVWAQGAGTISYEARLQAEHAMRSIHLRHQPLTLGYQAHHVLASWGLAAQIAAGVWMRNEADLQQAVQQYSQPPLSSNTLDLEVVLIQLYLARDPEALRPLINVFGGRQLLLMADTAVHWVGDQGAVISCPELLTAVELDTGMEDNLRGLHGGHDVEAPQKMRCIEDGLAMLHKVLTVRNIWHSPKDKRQWLRHNVIHWLHLEPKTHSGLEGLLPNDHQLLKLLDTEVLPEVAEQHSMGSNAVPVYQLQPELRRELNCNFLYCKPQQVMSAFGARDFLEAWACRPMPSGDPSALAGLLTVARSPVLLGLVWTTLRISQHRAAAGSADELAFAAMQLLAVAVKPRDDEGHVQFESSATLLLTGHAGMFGILSYLEAMRTGASSSVFSPVTCRLAEHMLQACQRALSLCGNPAGQPASPWVACAVSTSLQSRDPAAGDQKGEDSFESKLKRQKLRQQEALMAQMRSQQAAFLQHQEEPEAMEEAADEAAEPSEAAWPLLQLLQGSCAFCSMGSEQRPLGPLAALETCNIPSSVLREPLRWRECPVQPERAAGALQYDPFCSEADCSVGIHVLCCGHLAHEQCLRSYRMGEAAAETRSDLLEMHEDLCPLCRRVVHCVLPGLTHAVTADSAGLLPVQPAPSLEQLESHLQAVLHMPDTGPGRRLHPERATLPLRPASAQQTQAAVHSLEQQLVRGGCLAQHKRTHSYMRSLQCQSELQWPQDIDLHGHGTLAAALQRAFCSEATLEEVAGSVAERVLDAEWQEPPAAAFAAQRHHRLIEHGQGSRLEPGPGRLPSLQTAAWAVDMAGRDPQAPRHPAATPARASSHCDLWASLAHGVVHWEAAHGRSIGPGPEVTADWAAEAAKASWRGLQAVALPAMALGTGTRLQGPSMSEMAVEMVGYLLGSTKAGSLQRVACQHLQPDVGPRLLTNMAPHMRGVPAAPGATPEDARQAFLHARGCRPPADTQVQRLTGDPFALFLLLAAVGCDSVNGRGGHAALGHMPVQPDEAGLALSQAGCAVWTNRDGSASGTPGGQAVGVAGSSSSYCQAQHTQAEESAGQDGLQAFAEMLQAVLQLVVTMALTQSVVLLHGACCLQDQLLSWACSAPATRSNSDGGMDPHEEVLGEAMGRLQPLLNRMLVVRSLMLGQQLPNIPSTASTCQNHLNAWDQLGLPPPRQMLVLLGSAKPGRRHILLQRWTSQCEPRSARHLRLAGQQPRLLELPEKYQDVVLHLNEAACWHCQRPAHRPALCLLCGAVMCTQSVTCCPSGVDPETGHCWPHAQVCGAGSCVFLLLQKACALVISQSRASTVDNLYLDAHAEPDLMLRRGRQLFLSKAKWAHINQLWLRAAFSFDSRTLLRSRGGHHRSHGLLPPARFW